MALKMNLWVGEHKRANSTVLQMNKEVYQPFLGILPILKSYTSPKMYKVGLLGCHVHESKDFVMFVSVFTAPRIVPGIQ